MSNEIGYLVEEISKVLEELFGSSWEATDELKKELLSQNKKKNENKFQNLKIWEILILQKWGSLFMTEHPKKKKVTMVL